MPGIQSFHQNVKKNDVGGWVKVVHKKTNDFLADDGLRA
jgi:hypothetical protein